MKPLTWVSEVEVILNVTRYILGFPVFYPAWTRLLIVTNKNPKQDDHSYLPHKANSWKTQADVSIFCTVAHLPEALDAAHRA